jgi:hypothetical protein
MASWAYHVENLFGMGEARLYADSAQVPIPQLNNYSQRLLFRAIFSVIEMLSIVNVTAATAPNGSQRTYTKLDWAIVVSCLLFIFALAQIFVDHRLWYDAIAAYSQIISENRNYAGAYRERAQIYAQLPETEALANQDMEEASRHEDREDRK